MHDLFRLTTTVSSTSAASPTAITANLERADDTQAGQLGTGMSESSGIFTFPSTGIYLITTVASFKSNNQTLYAAFRTQFSVDSGSNYNVTKTTTTPRAYHDEADSEAALEYDTGQDLAQSTSFQGISRFLGNGNDECGSGTLHIFNPSSTTFVKHFIAEASTYYSGDYIFHDFTAGYGNTTSAVNAVQFKMSSGNIDAGTIKMYGVT